MRQVYGDVHEFFHAVSVFFNELASVSWTALAIALGLHLARILLRTLAYRNIVRAAYPEENVRWAPVAGAYIAGVGVNSTSSTCSSTGSRTRPTRHSPRPSSRRRCSTS